MKSLRLFFGLVFLSSFVACSGAHKPSVSADASFLKTGSIVLSQKLPSSSAPSTLVGYLPDVPVGKEFSSSGTVSVTRPLPVRKNFSPVVGYFGSKSLRSNRFRRSGTVSYSAKLPRL